MRAIAFAAVALLAACATEIKPPTADAGDARRVPPGMAVHLDGSGSSDPQDLPLSYSWSFRSLPAGSVAVLNQPHAVAPGFTPDLAGSYEVALVVSNGTKSSAASTVTVTADPTFGAIVPQAGFTATVAWAGTTELVNGPRGLAVGPDGTVYAVQAFGGAGNSPYRITAHTASGSRVVSQRGYLAPTAPQDVAWDPDTSKLLVTAGPRIIAVNPTDGLQSIWVDLVDAQLRGIAWATTAASAKRVYVTNGGGGNPNRIYPVDPTTTPPTVGTAITFAVGVDARNMWGALGFVSAAADAVFTTGTNAANNDLWTAFRTSGGTPIAVATDPILQEERDLAATPCATPKVVVASRATGSVVVLPDCSTTGCAGGTAMKVLAFGFGNPVGLAFDTTTTPASLLVSDEGTNAIYRVTGDFCSL